MMKAAAAATVLCVIAAAMPVQPASADSKSGNEAQIKMLEDKLAAAVSARNVDAIMSAYVPDQTLFVFDVVPPRQYVGAQAYRKDWIDFLAMFKGPVQLQINDLSVQADDKMGWGHSIQHVSGTGTKGQPINLTVRVTDVYRKIKGQWLIIHEHVSVPVDLDTGKPDLSSKP